MDGRLDGIEARPPYALFERGEFTARWERARQEMTDARLDALLVTSEANCVYLSGHETPGWAIKSRPHIFLLPLEGEPVLMTALTAEAAAFSPVADVRSYAAAGFEPAATAMLEDVIRSRGLARSRIGCELGLEQRLGMPFAEWRRLEAGLDDVTWVDAAPQLWRLRVRKSPAELEYMRRAARANAAAFASIRSVAKAGMSEQEVHRHFVVSLLNAGADRPGYTAMHSGEGNYGRGSSWPTDRVLRAGDLLYIDSGARYRGYWSDYNRTFAIGEPTAAQIRYYRAAYQSMRAALEVARPGIPVSKLWEAAEAVVAAEGFHTTRTTRDGHGIGLDLTEPPSVLPTEDILLEPGMVIAIEPRIDNAHGHFQTEENFLVTESGHELLSEPQSADLQTIQPHA